MAGPFTFLTVTEFEQLGSREKLAYLSDAMIELQRTRGSDVHGWENLFAQSLAQQQQQPQQPQQPQQQQVQPEPDPDPPEL